MHSTEAAALELDVASTRPAEPGPIGTAGRLLRCVDTIAETILVVALVGELIVVILNVLVRIFGRPGLLWSGEVSQFALATMTFVGGVVAYRRLQHAGVRAVLNLLPQRAQSASLALADFLVLLGALIAGFTSLTLVEAGWHERTPILSLPVSMLAIPLMSSMILLVVYACVHLWRDHRAMLLPVGLPLGAFLLLAVFTRGMWSEVLTADIVIGLVLALFVLTVFAGLPVAFALLLAAATYLWAASAGPMVALTQHMLNGTSNYVLLAVPFFIFAGLIMERGGISLRLVHFIHTLVGHLRGGLLQVMVVSMYLVSGLSGSKAADVAAVGSVVREMLEREKYSPGEGAAVLAASAAMGETIPPSIAMLVLGSITSISIAALFIAGLIPAAVIGVCLLVLIYVRARIANTPRAARSDVRSVARGATGAILPLLMPVMLFGGILLGIATPTEVSTVAVVYGIVLSMFIYRELKPKALLRASIDGATLTGMILFILAAASAFSFVLTVAGLPQRLVGLLHSVHDSSTIFMIGTVILLVVAGSLLEGLPALNVLAPLLLPIATDIGVSPLHYGIILIIAMGIGTFIPPAGIGFYVCCAVARSTIEQASKAMFPYLAVLMIGLLIVTFVPWFTLSLPRAFGFAK